MAACQPTILHQMYLDQTVGAWLASDDGLTADKSLSDVHRSTVGAELARDSGLIFNVDGD